MLKINVGGFLCLDLDFSGIYQSFKGIGGERIGASSNSQVRGVCCLGGTLFFCSTHTRGL